MHSALSSALTLQDRWAVFETTVALAWADGYLSASEVQAARIVADELALSGPFSLAGLLLRAGQASLPDGRPGIGSLLFASALWMAHADGQLHRREAILIARLRKRFGVSDDHVATASRRVESLRADEDQRHAYRQLLDLYLCDQALVRH